MAASAKNNRAGRQGSSGRNGDSVISSTKASHYCIRFPDGTEAIKRSFHCHEQTGVGICYRHFGKWYAATVVDAGLAETRFAGQGVHLPAMKVAFRKRWC
jgi:hypothetical protein